MMWRASIMVPNSIRIRADTPEQAKAVALDIMSKYENIDGFSSKLLTLEKVDGLKDWIPDDLPPPPIAA